MHFDVDCNLFWSNKCVMRWDIDELENTCDRLYIFAQAISLSPKFALSFERHQMIRELVNIYAKLHVFACLLEMVVIYLQATQVRCLE